MAFCTSVACLIHMDGALSDTVTRRKSFITRWTFLAVMAFCFIRFGIDYFELKEIALITFDQSSMQKQNLKSLKAKQN